VANPCYWLPVDLRNTYLTTTVVCQWRKHDSRPRTCNSFRGSLAFTNAC